MHLTELENLLSQMTLEEKVGQLVQLFEGEFYGGINGDHGVITKENSYAIGSITGVKGYEYTYKIQKEYMENSRLKIPLFFILDIVHGYKINYPIALGAGCSFNPELLKKCVASSTKEAIGGGINVTYSPMADMTFDPRWGRTIENTGEDHYLNRLFTEKTIEGFQENNVAACLKHFIGYGFCEGGRDYGTANFNDLTMYNILMEQARGAINKDVKFVMAGFSAVDGVPPTANKYLLDIVLRKQLNYDGIIISDHSSIPELVNHGIAKNEKEAAFLAFDAGVEIELCTTAYLQYLPELIREGRLDEEKLNQSVMRILKLKNELGLFENPYYMLKENEVNFEIEKECRDNAFELITESVVLAKNNGSLPITSEEYIVMGPHIFEDHILGFNAANAHYEDTVTIAKGLDNYNINYKLGAVINYYNNDINMDLPSNSKVLFFGGEFFRESGESVSRSNIQLDATQTAIIKKLKENNNEVNLILFNGRAMELTNVVDHVDSLLISFFPGTEGGNAIAAILKGDVSPSGRLTTSFVKSVGQLPLYYNNLPTGREKVFSDQEWVNGYCDIDNDPLFCFGHGLTYTTFEYSNCVINGNILSVDVTNTGDKIAKEVVQFYYWDEVAQVSRPKKQLFNFAKVSINPGATKNVSINISSEDFVYYNKQGEAIIEDGDITIFVAKSAMDVKFTKRINITSNDVKEINV